MVVGWKIGSGRLVLEDGVVEWWSGSMLLSWGGGVVVVEWKMKWWL